MNFFERLLGFSPDGGNGSLEMTFLLSIASTIMILIARKVFHVLRTDRS